MRKMGVNFERVKKNGLGWKGSVNGKVMISEGMVIVFWLYIGAVGEVKGKIDNYPKDPDMF